MYTIVVTRNQKVVDALCYDDFSLAQAAMDDLLRSDCFTSENVITLTEGSVTRRIITFTWQNGDTVGYSQKF